MFLKLIEVYEEITHHNKAEGTKVYHLREIVINPDFIVSMKEDLHTQHLLQAGKMPDGLIKEQHFTRVCLHKGNMGQDLVIVGSLDHITDLIVQNGAKRKTLKG